MNLKSLYIYSLIFTLGLLTVSCEEEVIDIRMHGNDGEYQMHAIVNTADTLSCISIRRVQGYVTKPVTNAEVDILVNGALRQTISNADCDTSDGRYLFMPNFNVGDNIQFIARADGNVLKATANCLQALDIVSVDTVYYTTYYSDSYSFNNYRTYIKIKKPKTNKWDSHYYRLDVFTIDDYIVDCDADFNYDTYEYTYIYKHAIKQGSYYSHTNDLALNNGNIEDGEDILPFLEQTSNRFGVFTDDFFDGDTYTLVVDVPCNTDWENEILCRVSTISADEYNFLRSVSSMPIADMESINCEPIMRSNVTGGMGFVAVESAAVFSLKKSPHFNPYKVPYM
ncbi:MAG: hypothetical protein Q4C30_01810 [Bacteroidia bacterium]|nr:hypothetical protein [Bacteroidia bacterium]